MALKRNKRFHAEIPTASLSDIMFFLLLFFLIISTLANPNVIKLMLPKAQTTETTKKNHISLSVTEDKHYFLDKQEVAFEELNLHRVGLGVYDDNQSAINCYQKSGFKTEGISRDIMWYNERWRSMIEMGMLDHEWKAMVNELDKVNKVG